MYSKITVLSVDDSAIARRFLKRYLNKMGITSVIESESVRTALQKLETENVDLIISDWNMPGRSGLEFLKLIRSDKSFMDIPFIMVTAEGLKGFIAEAFDAGVSSYILKPYTFETIKEQVETVLESR